MDSSFQITAKSSIAIVGGGPAGALTALHLLHQGAERGLKPKITIYEPRDFSALGPPGCKGCAGILSPILTRNLRELKLIIPETIIMNRLEEYAVHNPHTRISISNPEKDAEIIAVFRGGGPRLSNFEHQVSFDGWLLGQAAHRGAQLRRQAVTGIQIGAGGAWVQTGEGREEHDLVVLAAGVGAVPLRVSGTGYARPKTVTAAAYEIDAGAEAAARLGKTVHVLLIPKVRLIFSALVSKGPFINVVLLGKQRPKSSLEDILRHPAAEGLLPEGYTVACRCHPRIPVTLAQGYFGDRFVAVGDAAVSRLYKDGIGSAFLTARAAALTVLEHSTSATDFKHYYQPLCRSITAHNRWGSWLFALNDRVQAWAVFVLAQQRLISAEQADLSGPRRFTHAAWGMFSGSYNYGDIAWLALGPVSLFKLLTTVFAEGGRRLFSGRRSERRLLHVGTRRILILGGGFAGTTALKYLVKSLNRNENFETTLVSEDNFFVFTPLLHEVALGAIESRRIAYPFRSLQSRDRFSFVRARVTGFDLEKKQVLTSRGALEYDYMVIGLGVISSVAELNLPKADATKVLTLGTLRSARQIRNQIIDAFEGASGTPAVEKQRQYLTFIVAGGGYRGVQIVSELHDFIFRHLIRVYPQIDPGNIRIVLVETGKLIAAEMDRKLGVYAMRRLRRMGIEIKLNSRVTGVSDGHVQIDDADTIATRTMIWVAGQIANPVTAALNLARDASGRLLVNERMEVPDYPGVYAAGDCTRFIDPVTGKFARPLAHNGVRQAEVAAHNILSEIRGWDKRAFSNANNSEVISLGASEALFRYRGLRLHGRLGRIAWMLIYAFLVTGWNNRIRLVIDWTLTRIFGRDTTRVSPEL